MALLALAKRARKPSPVPLICSAPGNDAMIDPNNALCRDSRRTYASSPRRLLSATEPTMSVNRSAIRRAGDGAVIGPFLTKVGADTLRSNFDPTRSDVGGQ